MKCRSLVALLMCRLAVSLQGEELRNVESFREAAAKNNSILILPDWEQTPEAVEASINKAIDTANAALDRIGQQDLSKVTFQSTIGAADDLVYEEDVAESKARLIKETNPNPAMRTAAENALKKIQEWAVSVDYREDVYKAIKAFEKTNPKLTGEDAKLLKEALRGYRRAGRRFAPGETQGA